MNEVVGAGFTITGVDVSAGMPDIARRRHPSVELHQADICDCSPVGYYDLIISWDSTFHVPRAQQGSVILKFCSALAPGEVLLLTAGGIDGEISGEMHGQDMYYSSLADHEYLRLIGDANCRCLTLERDQYPLHHIVVIAARPA